jgi:hypothetical protein
MWANVGMKPPKLWCYGKLFIVFFEQKVIVCYVVFCGMCFFIILFMFFYGICSWISYNIGMIWYDHWQKHGLPFVNQTWQWTIPQVYLR